MERLERRRQSLAKMTPFWANQKLWTRIGVIASAIWLGIIMIISTVSRNFEWFPNSYSNEFKSELHFGPAFIVAAVGVALIIAICAGVPWIIASTDTSE
jgi:hypothetical protein